MSGKVCAVCGGGFREWHVHQGTAKHRRAMHGPVNRKGARATARRQKRAAARRQLSRRHQDAMYLEQEAWERLENRGSKRHYHGAWTPWGMPAILGGRPGRSKKKTPKARRQHLAALRDVMRSL